MANGADILSNVQEKQHSKDLPFPGRGGTII